MWTLSVTDTFLNELLNLPQNISKKVTKVIKILEKDPISAQGDAKKLKGYQNNIYRIRIADYRVFYSFGQGWVKLLSVRKRDERTYETEIPQFNIPSPPPDEEIGLGDNKTIISPPKVPDTKSPSHSPLTTTLPLELTPSLLKQWKIPQEYWHDILKVDNSEAILELQIPDKLISRILDNLYPRPIEEIATQTEYLLNDVEDLEKFFTGDITDFLLKLDPEQEKLRDFRSDSPVLVKGGPGTGKSTLALYRVKKLLDAGYNSILFTTYTNALVNYSQQLLEQLLRKPPKSAGVEVNTVDSLIYSFYTKKYPKPKFASEQDCLKYLQSAIIQTKIPAQNVFESRVISQTLEKLGLNYLFQEIQTVIQAWGISTVEEYKEASRQGRGTPLKANTREAIWSVYQTWLSLMAKNGLTTWEQVRSQALKLALESTSKPYQAIIIDEAQDLSPVALRFLLTLVSDLNGVYFTADASQSLYQRGFSWKQIHSELKFTGRTLVLKRNYRNTPQIIAACTNILTDTEAGDKESLYQELSPHQGDLPSLLLIDNSDKEIQAIRKFFITSAQKFRLPLHGSAVLCMTSYAGKNYAEKLTKLGLKAEFVSGKEIDLKAPHIKVLTLHSAKGLEFPFVVIVGLEKENFPSINKNLPSEEITATINEQRRLFYVGCSRAMRALMVCSSKSNPSEFINSLSKENWLIRN
jgi:mRNA-degrading endonuclease RelE of RelBE toxin-antitoxin system